MILRNGSRKYIAIKTKESRNLSEFTQEKRLINDEEVVFYRNNEKKYFVFQFRNQWYKIDFFCKKKSNFLDSTSIEEFYTESFYKTYITSESCLLNFKIIKIVRKVNAESYVYYIRDFLYDQDKKIRSYAVTVDANAAKLFKYCMETINEDLLAFKSLYEALSLDENPNSIFIVNAVVNFRTGKVSMGEVPIQRYLSMLG